MMNSQVKQIVTYVSPNYTPCEVSNRDGEVIKNFGLDLKVYTDIKELLSLVSTSTFASDLVIIDVEQFYKDPEVNPLDLIQTLFTLVEFNKKNAPRKIKISVAAGIKTSSSVIKDILSSNIGIYPRGDEFTLDEKMIAAKALLLGEHHVPLKIKDSIKSKKKIIDDPNIITLTPRQNQVLSLIVSRGASNKAIARILKISESTVKLHITAILKKYSLRNRTQLALFCRTDVRS